MELVDSYEEYAEETLLVSLDVLDTVDVLDWLAAEELVGGEQPIALHSPAYPVVPCAGNHTPPCPEQLAAGSSVAMKYGLVIDPTPVSVKFVTAEAPSSTQL
jgi:hypothetical protein